MGRAYIKKVQKPYTTETLKQVVKAYLEMPKDDQPTIKDLAAEHNIPQKTLSDHIHAERTGSSMVIGAGQPTALPQSVEEYLADGIGIAGELGWPMNRQDLKKTVHIYCQKMNFNIFSRDGPGDDWVAAFLKRWKSKISARTVESLTKKRAAGLTQEVRDAFFEGFGKKLDELEIKDMRSQIFNLDETGLAGKASSKGFFFKKEQKKLKD